MSEFLSYCDIVRGVGELVVDETKLVFHAIFRMPRSEGYRSDHEFVHPLDEPLRDDFDDAA